MNKSTSQSRLPQRKISETFLEFTAPLLQDRPSEATEQQLTAAFRVAFTAWNAVVCADVAQDPSFLAMARDITAGTPATAALLEYLIERKRTLFGGDQRLIGHWEIRTQDQELILTAEARDPLTPAKPN
jgi:hypothetical protein